MSRIVVLLEYLLLTLDILCNSLSDLFGQTVIQRLSIFVLQDLCLVLSLIILFLLFFRKKILQNQLLNVLLRNNWYSFLALFAYLSVTITLQTLVIKRMTSLTSSGQSNPGDTTSGQQQNQEVVTVITPSFWMSDTVIVSFFLIHRATSAIYYFAYRHSTDRLHDSHFIDQCRQEEKRRRTEMTSSHHNHPRRSTSPDDEE